MFGVALLTSTLLALTDSRIYDSCELARDLLKLGVSRENIPTWVCIAYHESRFDTAARNPNSGDHGLLQISELYWCGPGKACGVSCSAFRDDDISDDVECALQIHEEHTRLQGDGFLAWVVYPYHCKHNAKKYLANCDVFLKDTSNKLEDRGRFLKSHHAGQNHRELTSFHKAYPNIDELQPPTIPINTLLRGLYEANQQDAKFTNVIKEEDSNNYVIQNNDIVKVPQFNWLNTISTVSNKVTSNVRINNIDSLQPPVFRAAVFTTPSTTTVRVTAIDPAFIGIKPPNPRRLETNQFRRRMMTLKNNYLENREVKINDVASPKLPEGCHSNNFTTLPKYLNDQKTDTKVKSNNVSSFKIIETVKGINYTKGFTPTYHGMSSPVTLKEIYVSTTKTLSEVNNRNKKVKTSINTERNNKSSTTFSVDAWWEKYRTTPMPSSTAFSGWRFSFAPQKVGNQSSQTTNTTWYKSKYTTRPQDAYSTNTKNDTPTYHGIISNRKSLKEMYVPTTETVLEVSNRNKKANESINTEKNNKTQTTSVESRWEKYRTTTMPTSTAFNRWRFSFTPSQVGYQSPQTSNTPWSKSTYSTRSHADYSTSTSLPEIKSSTALSTLSTVTERTTRSTQSIFDLYLNPTKKPNIEFRFPELPESRYKIKIFSGGTTTHSPTKF